LHYAGEETKMAVALIGNPNVGKSSVLNRLCGSSIFVSNYPGTSVEVTKTKFNVVNRDVDIYDTPGIYSLHSPGEEQRVVKEMLKSEDIELILNIVDATNLERNLVLTYELLELGIPVVVVVNQIDRARVMGIKIDPRKMRSLLHSPVILFSAVSGEGLVQLIRVLESGDFAAQIDKPGMGKKVAVDLSLSGRYGERGKGYVIPTETSINEADLERAKKARDTAKFVTTQMKAGQKIWLERIQNILDHPVIGVVLLLFFAYLGFLLLLKSIELSEGPISTVLEPVNRFIGHLISEILPSGIVSSVLSKAVPEGLIIPFTIIMPAMLMVSLLMSILEDTGLLPRYSVALERAGSFFGVSGQAVIPLSLGFGCRTPAILATRIMPSEAERFIVITLLSIVIPCAATLGIMASVVSTFEAYLPVIVLTMLATLTILGFILSRIMPGESVFVYELPPLRLPMWSNVWSKVKVRFSGFFTEVLPLLLLMNIIIRALMESGLLNIFHDMENFTRFLFGIPAEAFVAVLITIFQRYLAPLVLLNLPLTPREATIAITMIALSLPCLPVMVMTVREIGLKGLIKVLIMAFSTSFAVGIILNCILPF